MKKKHFFTAVAVLSAALAALIVSSCSSESAEEQIDYTLSQKEKIEKLAEEYGLQNAIEMRPLALTRTESLSDIEEEFRYFSSFVGRYDICGTQNSDSLSFTAIDGDCIMPSILSGGVTEHYSLSTLEIETLYGIQYCFYIQIGLTTNPTAISSVKVTEQYSSTELNCTTVSSQAVLVGSLPGSIEFSCQIRLSGTFCNYCYNLTGTYYISSGTGYIYADLCDVHQI